MKKKFIRIGRAETFPALIPLCLALAGGTACANPQGMTVLSGSAQSSQQGNTLQITTSQTASLQWSSFNIASGQTTIFKQPSAASIVFNNINNASPSAIFGSLRANGIVVLENSKGFYFGPNAFVQAGGLVVTTAAINPWSSGGGAGWSFDGPPAATPIVNYGTLETASGGSLYLIAKQIGNHGTIAAPGGTAALVAGQEVLLSQRPDGLSLSAPVKLPAGSVNNQGQVVADAGRVLLQAQTVNNSGVIQADSVRQNHGVIELYASQDIQLGGSSVVQANGDANGVSAGGDVVIKSGGSFSDNAGSRISAAGGAQGGDGGSMEVSAPNLLSLNSSLNAGAQPGFKDGQLSLDPQNITLSSSGSSASSGTILEGSSPASGTLTLNVNSLNSFSAILLQASKNITLATSWTLPDSPSATSLTLEAGNNITFNTGDSLAAGQNWSVNLMAGVNNFSTPPAVSYTSVTATHTANSSSITLSQNASLQTDGGNVTLIAGGAISISTASGSTGTIQSGGGSILLQAVGQSIALGPTQWDLADVPAPTPITLQAANNITIASGGGIVAGLNWNMNLAAGVSDFGRNTVAAISTSGSSSITLKGSAVLQTANGSINAQAGNSVTVTSGGTTSGLGGIVTGIVNEPNADGTVSPELVSSLPGNLTGGSITVLAAGGSVYYGSSTHGYLFSSTGATPDTLLGGISTASGGDVTIQAPHGNIEPGTSSGGATYSDSGSGAFGDEPGNVTLIAGGNVTGHYVLANGVGSITAANAGSGSANALALSLIKGGWTVTATDHIYLQEVRNPNGVFNDYIPPPGSSNPDKYLFNYDPLSYVTLNAEQVTITGPAANTSEGLIFPPTLTIQAGAGGIILNQSLILFPSPAGNLVMTTTGGGNYTANGNAITISDSTAKQWKTSGDFTTSGANDNVLHLNDPNPVQINISGSVYDLSLSSPKPVEMYVTGDIIDSTATIQNLLPTDTSVISAGGQILNHTDYVIVTLPRGETPDKAALDLLTQENITGPGGAQIPNPNYNSDLSGVWAAIIYNPATGGLEYKGKMSSGTEQALLAMTTPFLDAATIKTIYTESQNESTTAQGGFSVAGPGTLRVSAASINLGNGSGITSVGFQNNPALIPFTARGAGIDITTSGDFNMIATGVESGYGGDINITCGGSIDVGSLLVPASNGQIPLGIVSLWQGNINVIAEGNINVDGSRIAAYDGGNIFVESLHGNVNAGTGVAGSALVQKYYPGQRGHVPPSVSDVIPGSGIIATSLPQSGNGENLEHVGNITVDTPEGDIDASKGGIMQLALGPVAPNNNPTINLNAGSRNPNGSVAYVGSVNAAGSGVVGGHVNATATGNINGVFVASLSANLNAQQNITATVLSQGTATVNAGQSVSGTIVGSQSVSVSATSDAAAAFSAGSVSASGTQTGAAIPSAPTGSSSASAAATTQQVNQTTQANSDLVSSGAGDDNDPLKKKKAQLMEYQGRVTVLLPE